MKFASVLFAALLVAVPVVYTQAPPQTQTVAAPQMKSWFVHLIPPRPTFATDMTEAEGTLMQQHFVYWKEQYAKGVLIFGGPVLDSRGAYGVLVLRAATEDEARAIAAADPSVKGGMNKIDVAEMRVAFPSKNQ